MRPRVAAGMLGAQRRDGAGGHAGEGGGDVDGQQQVEGGRAGWDQPGRLLLAGEMGRHLENDRILDEATHLV